MLLQFRKALAFIVYIIYNTFTLNPQGAKDERYKSKRNHAEN
jgi:hypothetical protein